MNTKELNRSHQKYDAQPLPSKLQRRESNQAPLAYWTWNIPLDH